MRDLEKNRLDLAYHKQLYHLNFILIIVVGSLITLFIGIILHPENWFNYSVAFAVLSILAYIGYSKVNEKLKDISLKIKHL